MKKFIKEIAKLAGYEIRKIYQSEVKHEPQIGSDLRPVGSMELLIEDLKYRGLSTKAVLDIGANRANWSKMVKKHFPEAFFYLIEPQLEMKGDLEKFCYEFDNCFFFLAGAGATKDTLILTIWDDLAGSSFLPEPDTILKNAGKQREVEIITVDDLIQSSKIKMPELVKLDIQGYELEALRGAEKTFGYTEVYILEVSFFTFNNMLNQPVFSDVINFMLERGYVVYDFPGFLRRPFDGALGQCDVCFVKKDGFLRKSNAWD